MLGCGVDLHPTTYRMNECEYTRPNQLDILYVQSGASSVGFWYNLPGKGAPKGFQSRVNVGFIDTGISTVLEV